MVLVKLNVKLLNEVVPSYHFAVPPTQVPLNVTLSPEQITALSLFASVGANGLLLTVIVVLTRSAGAVSQSVVLLSSTQLAV